MDESLDQQILYQACSISCKVISDRVNPLTLYVKWTYSFWQPYLLQQEVARKEPSLVKFSSHLCVCQLIINSRLNGWNPFFGISWISKNWSLSSQKKTESFPVSVPQIHPFPDSPPSPVTAAGRGWVLTSDQRQFWVQVNWEVWGGNKDTEYFVRKSAAQMLWDRVPRDCETECPDVVCPDVGKQIWKIEQTLRFVTVFEKLCPQMYRQSVEMIDSEIWRRVSFSVQCSSISFILTFYFLLKTDSGRFRLIKDGHLLQERGKETWDFQRICTGFVTPW